MLASPLLSLVHETRMVTRLRASLVFRLRLFNLFFLGLAVVAVVAVDACCRCTVLLCCCVTVNVRPHVTSRPCDRLRSVFALFISLSIVPL